MTTHKERDDIGELKTETAVMKRDIKYLVKSVDNISEQIKSMSFVSLDTYNKDHKEIKERVKALEDYNEKNQLGTVFANLISNKGLTLLAAGLIAAAIYVISKGGGVQ